jgi:hypothetical protein
LDHDGGYSVAGWQSWDGDWQDVETGEGLPLEEVYPDDLEAVEMATIHYTNSAGDDIYFTIHGPFDDWESMELAIDDALDSYGIES